jgi:hypothetical protein
MFDDLVSKNDFDTILYNNTKTRNFSLKHKKNEHLKRVTKNKEKFESAQKIEEDLIPLNERLINLGFSEHFTNEISFEKKKDIVEAFQNKKENLYDYGKLEIFNLGVIWVKDLVIHKDGATFKEIIFSEPKSNFGKKHFYPFSSMSYYGNILKIEIPEKKIKRERKLLSKRTKWKLVFPLD